MTAQILTVKQQLYKIENQNFSVSNIQIIFKKKIQILRFMNRLM